MMRVRKAQVVEARQSRKGLARLLVTLGDQPPVRAYALDPWCEGIEAGDEVLVNTTASELRLGSSEGLVVLANLTRPEAGDSPLANEMKLRYAASQVAPGATVSDLATEAVQLAGIPVVVAELHSALAPILGALRLASRKPPRVAWVVPDWNSLPVVLSETAARARELGWLEWTITCGHAYGGDLEAAGLAAGLALASEAGAEVALVIAGPGHLGARQPFGFSGACQAEALHLAWALGGSPVFASRLSEADPRERHRGVSHHTEAILGRLLLTDVDVPLPDDLDSSYVKPIRGLCERTGSRVSLVPIPDYAATCEEAGLCVSSMGRGWSEDRLYFDGVAAAGVRAAAVVEGSRR